MDEQKNLINDEECRSILRNYLKTKDFDIVSYKVEPLPSKDGFLGEHFTIEIDFNGQNEVTSKSFFLKIINSSSQVMFDLCKNLNAYEKENFFYTTLIPEFQRYNIDVGFAPKYYFCKSNLIVLEDLSTQGYKAAPKKEWLDLEHCKMSLNALASFHSSALIYEEKRSKEDGTRYSLMDSYANFLQELMFSNEDNAATKFFRYSIEGLFELINTIFEDEDTRTEFSEKLQNVLESLTIEDSSSTVRCTILHGDLWCSNFLYLYHNKQLTSVKLLDYQFVKYGPPSLDVLQLLYTNTRKNFRDLHKNELLEHYYQELCDILHGKSIDIANVLPKEEFLSMCEEVKIPAKLQSIVDRCITFMADDNFVEAHKCEETLSAFIFENRSKHIIDAFNKDSKFRELILEDMSELKDLVCKT